MNDTQLPSSIALAEEKNKLTYSKLDAVTLLISIVFGYLFSKWGGLYDIGAGTFVLSSVMIAGSLLFLHIKKIPVPPKCYVFIALTAVFSTVLILSSSESVKLLAAFYVIVSTFYWMFTVCLTSADGDKLSIIDDFIALNIIKAALVVPFSYIVRVFESTDAILTSLSGKGRSAGKKVLMVIGGLCAAVIPTAIIMGLLLNADDAFSGMIDRIFTFTLDKFFLEFVFFITGVPAGLYVFNVLYGNAHRNKCGDEKFSNSANFGRNESFTQKLRFASPFVIFASVTPICLIYTLFFAAQSAYFLSPFKNIIPDGFTHAEYARKGFFELCAVAVINIFIIIYITLLTKRKGNSKNHAIKVYVTLISAYTLVMIAIATAKMAMYINAYGLTIMRLYPTWFMILLSVVFILIIVRQFVKFKLFTCIFAVFIVMFAVLIFVDFDSIIANYNIDRYLTGSLDSVDTDMIRFELSDSAVPALLKLLDDDNPFMVDRMEDAIYERYSAARTQKMNFPNFNLASYLMMKEIEAAPQFDKLNAVKIN
jgi:hypothetical protein